MKKAAIVLLGPLMLLSHALAGEVSLARVADNPDPRHFIGIQFEGEILPGDTEKIRAALKADLGFNTVYLSSKGGDVLEAMKIGRLIRRLRLGTSTGFNSGHVTGERVCSIKLTKEDNCICASACFIAFAGGAHRIGHNLVLHRPFLTKASAAELSDVRHEDAQKAVMLLVRKYLEEMEVPNFYIDAMMAKSSQDAYMVKSGDDTNYRLNGFAPSIEEITLTKCKPITDEQFIILVSLTRKRDRRTPEENYLFNELSAKSDSGGYCQRDVMEQLRVDAFKREFPGMKQ